MKNSPIPPDPYATAAAQTASNLKTGQQNQETNMVNQSNPYGSLTYAQTGTNPDGTPIYSANTTLNSAQQGLLNQSNAAKAGALGAAGGLATGGQGAFSGQGPDLSYNGTTAALDALNKSRLDPQWASNDQHQADTLAARGITPGTPAYDNAMRVYTAGKNDAYNSANLADYQTSSNNALSQWGAPVAAYNSLMSSSGPTNFNPMNTPTTNIPGTNVAGLVEQNYQQQSQNANTANGQLGGLLGAGLGAVGTALGGPLGGMAGGGLGRALGGLFGGGSSTAMASGSTSN